MHRPAAPAADDRVHDLVEPCVVVDAGADLRGHRDADRPDRRGDDALDRVGLFEQRGARPLAEYAAHRATEVQVEKRRSGRRRAARGLRDMRGVGRHDLETHRRARSRRPELARRDLAAERGGRDAQELRARTAGAAEVEDGVAKRAVGHAFHRCQQQPRGKAHRARRPLEGERCGNSHCGHRPARIPGMLTVEEHPLLALAAFTTEFARPLGEIDAGGLAPLLAADAEAPIARDEARRAAVRDLLRHGGYKPTGRGKPASEYLVKAAESGRLGPINAAVDACNVTSLHSGFPISVVDLDRSDGPHRIAIAPADASYVFNASGQTIDLAGLLCVFDADGPCANAVKDSQRTKTSDATTRTLSVMWACRGEEAARDAAVAWYRELLESLGATTAVAVES